MADSGEKVAGRGTTAAGMVDLSDASETVQWMRKQGVASLRLRQPDGAELAITLDPMAETGLALQELAEAAKPEASPPAHSPPSQGCREPSCGKPLGGIGRLYGYCREHALSRAGVRGGNNAI